MSPVFIIRKDPAPELRALARRLEGLQARVKVGAERLAEALDSPERAGPLILETALEIEAVGGELVAVMTEAADLVTQFGGELRQGQVRR